MATSCPLCMMVVEPSDLEAHFRFELRLPLYACSLCPVTFADEEEAAKHFAGPFAKHSGSQVQLMKPPSDPVKEGRLVELLRLARGGTEAVEQRLCVCGHCRLLCRDDFRDPLPVSSTQHFRIGSSLGSLPQYSTERHDPAFRVAADACREEVNIASADQLATETVQKHQEHEAEEDGLEAYFDTDMGQLRPSQITQPSPDNCWSTNLESEMTDQPDQELHGRHILPGSKEGNSSVKAMPLLTTGAAVGSIDRPGRKWREGKEPAWRPPKPRADNQLLVPAFFERLEASADVRCGHCAKRIKRSDGRGGISNGNLVNHLMRSDHLTPLASYSEAVRDKAKRRKTEAQ